MYKNVGFLKVADQTTPKNRKIKDFLITFGLCALAMGIVFSFIWIAKIPSKQLLEPQEILGEWSSPTVARLILTCIDLPIVIACVYFAIRFDKSNKLFISMFFAYLGGTFLWQLIGECLWHFGFFRIETGPAIPFAVITVALLMYCYKKNTFSWPILIFIIGFMSNWLGHLCEIGAAQLFYKVLDMKKSYIIFGCLFGGGFLLHCLYHFIFNATSQKGRIISAMGVFICCCVIMFAFVEG